MKQELKTKKDLVDAIATNTSLPKGQVERVITLLTIKMSEMVRMGYLVRLTDFGTFRLVHKKARTGVNPATGSAIKIPASNSVKFTVSSVLKRSCNRD